MSGYPSSSSSSSVMQAQHELHVRRLLDQRAERAGLSPVAPSEYAGYNETPSMYSAHFSPPRPRALFESTLDLDEDDEDEDTYSHPHSPYASAHEDEYDSDAALGALEDENRDPRMSVLGPKMRFHSLAPWETEHEPVAEQDEPDDDSRSFVSKRGKPGFIKSLGLGSASKGSRPSTDSSRSSGREKKSFETTSSLISAGGALHALAQASMSSTSVVHAPTPAPTSMRSKFPTGRRRSRTQSGGQHHGLSLHPPAPVASMPSPSSTQASPIGNHTRSSSPAPSVFSTTLSRSDTRASSRPTSPLGALQQEYVHPYANPDVSSPYRTSFQLPPIPTKPAAEASMGASIGGGIVRSSSPTGSVAPSIAPSVLNSNNEHYPRRPGGGLNGRTISGPIPMDNTAGTLRSAQSFSSIRARAGRDPKLPQGMPAGFAELPSSPTFTLISLQEAQAQARTRGPPGMPDSNAPFLQYEPALRSSPNVAAGSGIRNRSRSTSTGIKARSALQSLQSIGSSSAQTTPSRAQEQDAGGVSPVAGGPPPPKLKHKKSGFMRLFNKGEEPPPVPSIAVASQPAQPSGYASASAGAPYTPRPPPPRVPVPRIGFEEDRPPPPSANSSDGSSSAGSRRKFPPLAIIPPPASASVQSAGALFSAREGNPSHTTLIPERGSPRPAVEQYGDELMPVPPRERGSPSSAPPAATQFSSLSLRPVSSVFGAQFSDALGGEYGLELDHDASTSRSSTSGMSPTSALSPITPGFAPAYAGHQARASESGALIADAGMAAGDPAAVVAALQAQIVGARKAWQRQIWELEGQVRDLRAEMEEMRAKERAGARCAVCGRGGGGGVDEEHSHYVARKGSLPVTPEPYAGRGGVVNRPRARTGVGGRFGTPS